MIEAPLVYLDTNFFIRAFELVTDQSALERSLVDMFRQRPGAAATSELTLAELLAPTANVSAPAARSAIYREVLLDGNFVRLVPVSREILLATVDAREAALANGRKPKLPDAIHIASATSLNCRYFVSMDKRLGPMPAPMRRLELTIEDMDILKQALNV